MKTIVLGLGISGRAAANFLRKRGDEVIGVDRIIQTVDGLTVLSDAGPIQLEGVDLVIKSPGIPSTHAWVQAAHNKSIPVMGEIDLAFAEFKKRGKRLFGITGSNGKTTTTLLTAHLFNTVGKKALATGNVGAPLIAHVESDEEVLVVELSSFQLEHCVENRVLDGAVILNITPNHLDRHSDFNSYQEAKLRICHCLKENAPLYISKQVESCCTHIPRSYEVFNSVVDTISSLGYRDGKFSLFPHDLENLSAAYALTRVSKRELMQGISTFVRPPHRLEWVRTVAGVNYINDSKATSVDAVVKAVQALPGPIVLIAGGVDKGGAFTDWLPSFKGKVVRILALGQAAGRIESELMPELLIEKVSSLEQGVCRASKAASLGDTVLLSPGCSSYDQFRDYQHRGEVFREIVGKL